MFTPGEHNFVSRYPTNFMREFAKFDEYLYFSDFFPLGEYVLLTFVQIRFFLFVIL